MKIKSVRVQNFRSFQDETIHLNRYSCFVGPNGAGKSNVLSALNAFFRDQNSATDVSKLVNEDYFGKNTDNPIRITVTFDDLSRQATAALSGYVRQGELIVTAEAKFEPATKTGIIKHYGSRLGLRPFARFFAVEKAGGTATQLTEIYNELKAQFGELSAQSSKEKRANALREYEAAHPDQCESIESEDNFYGFNSTGKLSPFVQWIYVPAVKDAGEEVQEAKDTVLGKLVARVVRTKTTFDADIEALKNLAIEKYKEIMANNQAALSQLSQALQRRLEEWAHPNVKLGMEWIADPAKAVSLTQPVAGIKTGEGDFLGSLARMGHGLQRSYLLALLQELAASDAPDAPTLILGCEEPELYQHPPQAKHLASVFEVLARGNNQIIVTTHSPLFVSGQGFENVRLVRKANPAIRTVVKALTFTNLCARIRAAMGGNPQRQTDGLVAKIHQTLQPNISEMFFAKVPILVEGLEDVAYITTGMYLYGNWDEYRRLGCHLVAVNGKDKLIQPVAISAELDMSSFVVFDADGDNTNPAQRPKHENDNKALQSLLGIQQDPFPADHVWGVNHVIWTTNITEVVKSDIGADYSRIQDEVRLLYAQEPDLNKNGLFISEWLSKAHDQGKTSSTLQRLCAAIITYAGSI